MVSPTEQLPKLLRLTASDKDHEVLAAVRAINPIVLKHDLDSDQLLANGSALALTEEQLQRVHTAGLQEGYERGFADGQAAGPAPGEPKQSSYLGTDADWARKVLEAAKEPTPTAT